jgi:Condensation domain
LSAAPANRDLAAAPRAEREVRASPAQELRWRSSSYQLANRVYRLSGPLDVAALEEAFASLVARHEALRAGFELRGGELLMHIRSQVPTPLFFVDARDRPTSERETAVQRCIDAQLGRPFEREIPPLIRATLIQVDEGEHVLVVSIDHLVADGWSIDVIARDLSRFYRQALGEVLPPAPPPMQYPDLAARQWEDVTEERLAALADFYGRLFPNGPADMGVRLPGWEGPASSGGEPARGVALNAHVGRDATAGLRRAARKLRVTLFGLTATVFARQLRRESGQERVTLSTSFAGRTGVGARSMIGYVARSLWVPTTPCGTDDLALDARVFQRDLLDVIRSADIPPRVAFERIWSVEQRAEMNLVPRADFLCMPFWGDALALPGIRVEPVDADEGVAEAAVLISLTDRGSHMDALLQFAPAQLEPAYARSLFQDYLDCLDAVAARA